MEQDARVHTMVQQRLFRCVEESALCYVSSPRSTTTSLGNGSQPMCNPHACVKHTYLDHHRMTCRRLHALRHRTIGRLHVRRRRGRLQSLCPTLRCAAGTSCGAALTQAATPPAQPAGGVRRWCVQTFAASNYACSFVKCALNDFRWATHGWESLQS